MKQSLIVLTFFLASTAFAQTDRTDRTVFGLEMGKTIEAPECGFMAVVAPYGVAAPASLYSVSQPITCFERTEDLAADFKSLVRKSGLLRTETVEIKFPAADTSKFMAKLRIFAGVIDGKLERVELDTYGVEDTDPVMAELTKKYGEPTSSTPHQVETRTGSTFDAISADWNFPDLFVHFESVASSIDSGMIQIETAKGREVRQAANVPTGKPL